MRSQVNLHTVVSHFPARVAYATVLIATFIQYRIGVVDMDIDLARALEPRQPLQAPVRPGNRQMPHLLRRAGGSLYPDQFIVGIKGAIVQEQIASFQTLEPSFFYGRYSGH